MADTTFINGVTLTDSDWFNDVDRLHYTIFGDPADDAAARTNLGLGALAVLDTVGAGAQGRITLTSGTPVTTTDVTGATTVYFTPYKGNKLELYDGTDWVLQTFTEMSQATSDTTKSPAAVANNSNYDLFVWNDSGTLRCTRGPAWTSDTARGTGAGTTELEVLEGRYVNKIAITNGPAAQRGLYVGTVRSDSSAQINDSRAKRHVWNNYNRTARPMLVVEAANTWTYNTNGWRQANANSANQLDMVIGLSEDEVRATVYAQALNDGGSVAVGAAVGLDSASAKAAGQIGLSPSTPAANQSAMATATYTGFPGIGRHYLAWLENGYGQAGTTTWFGDNGGSDIQTGIEGRVMA